MWRRSFRNYDGPRNLEPRINYGIFARSSKTGITDLDDVLKTRLADNKADRNRARSAPDRMKEHSPAASTDRVKIERFGSLMRENITTGDIPFRKAYSRWLIDAVEVDDRLICIHGSKSTLEQAVVASLQAGKGGRSFVRKWRARKDSSS